MKVLELPALMMEQSPGRAIIAFGVDAKLIPSFSDISRIRRDGKGNLFGYQRPEVRNHIAEIRRYIDSDGPMIPNALVIAFSPSVKFVSAGVEATGTQVGHVRIPIRPEGERKVGWIVDGQQRVAAIRESCVAEFPMFAIGFIAKSDSEARAQFMLVNSTKPLPKSLMYELLPDTDAQMPSKLAKLKYPATLLQVLNHHEDSPLRHAISGATNHGARIKDNSILTFLKHSLSDGILYDIRVTEEDPMAAQLLSHQVLFDFWRAVRSTWQEIWELSPKRSKLLGGVGVVTLGYLMDAIAGDYRSEGKLPSEDMFAEHLAAIKPHCRWNEGHWEFGPKSLRGWNEIQNTSKDVIVVTNHLSRKYKQWLRNKNG